MGSQSARTPQTDNGTRSNARMNHRQVHQAKGLIGLPQQGKDRGSAVVTLADIHPADARWTVRPSSDAKRAVGTK